MRAGLPSSYVQDTTIWNFQFLWSFQLCFEMQNLAIFNQLLCYLAMKWDAQWQPRHLICVLQKIKILEENNPLINIWVTSFRPLGQTRQWRDLRSSELVDWVQKDEKRPLHRGELEQFLEVSCDWNLQRDSSQSMRRSFTFFCEMIVQVRLSTIFFPEPCRPGYPQREACLCSKSAGRSTW